MFYAKNHSTARQQFAALSSAKPPVNFRSMRCSFTPLCSDNVGSSQFRRPLLMAVKVCEGFVRLGGAFCSFRAGSSFWTLARLILSANLHKIARCRSWLFLTSFVWHVSAGSVDVGKVRGYDASAPSRSQIAGSSFSVVLKSVAR